MARTKIEKERDYHFITDLYLKRYSTRAIAKKLCEHVGNPKYVSHVIVFKDLKAIMQQWRDERIDDLDEAKTKELAAIDKLEATYWDAWEKSIEDYEKKAKKLKGTLSKDGSKSTPSEQEIATTEMISMGNPAYLAGIDRCIERRSKILGIDAPSKVDVTSGGKEIKGITSVEVVHVSKEELDKRNEDASNSGIRQDPDSIQRKQI